MKRACKWSIYLINLIWDTSCLMAGACSPSNAWSTERLSMAGRAT